jgi:Uma2 family endonuclease
MPAKEFLEWGLHQELRYELVDGVPVAMAGAKQRHDRIVGSALGMLYNLPRGHECRQFTADLAVRIPMGSVRRPDVGIDCGPPNDDATTVIAPILMLEVLSPSTRDFDMFGKLEEYKTVPALTHIVIVDPDTPQVFHWSQSRNESWRHERLEGLDAVIQLHD